MGGILHLKTVADAIYPHSILASLSTFQQMWISKQEVSTLSTIRNMGQWLTLFSSTAVRREWPWHCSPQVLLSSCSMLLRQRAHARSSSYKLCHPPTFLTPQRHAQTLVDRKMQAKEAMKTSVRMDFI